MSSQIQIKLRRPDWSSLPADVIEVISNLTADDADFVRLRSVCTAWRSAATERPRIPWLLVRYDDSDDPDKPCLGLCNFPSTDFSTSPRLSQSIIRGKVFCGSSHGWIALLDDTLDESLSLRNNIYPDHLFRHFTSSAKKVYLSSDPRMAPFTVVALNKNNGRLICCRSGDVSWTVLPSFIEDDGLGDIIFYGGEFYAVQTYRVFHLRDIGSENTDAIEILPTIPLFSDGNDREGLSYTTTSYLVESSGELLLVAVTLPHMECDDHTCDECDNFSFEVFRVDLDGRMSLFKLDTLGGRSLFLGCGSMSVSGSNSPRCRGDCIYFLSDMEIEIDEWDDAIVVFSMEDGEVSFIPAFSDDRVNNWEMHWLTPSLC